MLRKSAFLIILSYVSCSLPSSVFAANTPSLTAPVPNKKNRQTHSHIKKAFIRHKKKRQPHLAKTHKSVKIANYKSKNSNKKHKISPLIPQHRLPAPPKSAPIAKSRPNKIQARLWNLRQADIRSVINEVAKETHKNFIIDPRVQGRISIVSDKPMTGDEIYPVFLSMLQVSGFAAVPQGKVIKVVPNIEAKTLGGNGHAESGQGKGDEMIVQVVPVKYVSSEQLVPVLRPLMPQWSNVSAYGPSNMLILAGRASNIKRLANIIHAVDASSSKGIDIVRLHNTLAMDIANTLKTLLENPRASHRTETPVITADDRGNAILISGNKTDRMRIRILINQLDSPGPYGVKGNTQVVYLHYLRAQDLVPILAGIAQANFSGNVGTTIGTITTPTLDTSSPITDTSTTNSNTSTSNSIDSNSSSNYSPQAISPNTQATSNSTEGDNKPKVQLIAEPNTNAIIISAPSTLMRTLKSVIAQLDIRPAQVLVEALITEINETDVNQLGIDWGTVVNESGTATFTQGVAVIDSTSRLSQFQAKLTALITQQRANILSTPSLVVLDNHQAKILVGKQISVQDSSYPGTGTGGAVANPYTTFTRQNVALHLYVRPQISQGRSIQLQIDHGNDTLTNDSNPTSGLPIINTSSIVTSVLVNSGNVLVLGGLMQNSLNNNGSSVPILGQIPGIGKVFQNNKRNREKKVLMVFIRPVILQSEKNGLQVTGSKYADLRSQQLKSLQKEPYDKNNKEILLKSLNNKVTLPLPFS